MLLGGKGRAKHHRVLQSCEGLGGSGQLLLAGSTGVVFSTRKAPTEQVSFCPTVCMAGKTHVPS